MRPLAFSRKILRVARSSLLCPELGVRSVFLSCRSCEPFSSQGRGSRKLCASRCLTDVPVASLDSVPLVGGDGSLHPPNMFLKPQVVLYDGVCHLCNAGVKWLIQADKDKRISFCAVQSDVAEPYLLVCGLTREDVLARFLFVEGPGQFSQASTAALRLTIYLPFPYPILAVLLGIPAPLRDAIYDYVAKRRYHWFGKSDTCILPSDDVLDRFVDRKEILAKLKQKEEA